MAWKKSNTYPILLLAGITVIFLFQISGMAWSRQFTTEFMHLNYGGATLLPAFLETFSGVIGGIVLAVVLPVNWKQAVPANSNNIFLWAILTVVPLLALLVKFFFAAGGAYTIHPPLRFMNFWEWALYSPVPSLWLGLVIGVFIRSRLTLTQREGTQNG